LINSKFNFAILLSILFVTLIPTRKIQGDTTLIHDNFLNYISISGRKPKLGHNSENNTKIITSTFLLSARFLVANNIISKFGIPFSYWELKINSFSEKEFTVGNPYLGFEIFSKKHSVSGEFGINLPLAPGNNEKNGQAAAIGFMTNYINRAEAFEPNRIPIYVGLNYYYKATANLIMIYRGGTSLWFDSKGGEKTNSYLLYKFKIGYIIEKVTFFINWDGRFVLHEKHKYFNEKLYNQFGLEIKLNWNNFQPSFFFVKPLTNAYESSINSYVGARLIIYLK
jgi:hypothetical protein